MVWNHSTSKWEGIAATGEWAAPESGLVWVEGWDEAYNLPYYLNFNTGESQWEYPTAPGVQVVQHGSEDYAWYWSWLSQPQEGSEVAAAAAAPAAADAPAAAAAPAAASDENAGTSGTPRKSNGKALRVAAEDGDAKGPLTPVLASKRNIFGSAFS